MADKATHTPEEPGDSRLEMETGTDGIERRNLESDKVFVVGIGASAGGLEALGELVKYVPLDRMAFVVVQHLAPHHESVLTQLLSRTSKVEVVTAADGMVATSNHVYVIPPNTDLALLRGVIRLVPPAGGE